MTATKKKQSKPSGGGTLMSMRSGFQKAVGQGKNAPAKKKWTFQQVFYIVAGVALLIALVYAFTAR